MQWTRGAPVRLVLINTPIAPILFNANIEITYSGLFSINKTTLSLWVTPSLMSLLAKIFAASLVCEYVNIWSSKYIKFWFPYLSTLSWKVWAKEALSSGLGHLYFRSGIMKRSSLITLKNSMIFFIKFFSKTAK